MEIIDFKKFEFGTCFFCDKLVTVSEKIYSKEDYKNLRELLGEIPEKPGGKIGNKIICKSCKGDILAMLSEIR